MDRKKIANNILDLMVDPTMLPPERRLYFRPEEILDNRMYEQTRAFVDQAYGNQSQNSDMYPLRNRALKREVYGMDRRTLIASLDILSQTFKEADPIAKDLRTMAYAVSKMDEEELATRMAENAPESLDEGMEKSAKNPWMEHMKKVRKENPDKSLKELIEIAKKTYKKASEDEEIPSDEEISKMAEIEADEEAVVENFEDNWGVEASDAVQSALISDILGEDVSATCGKKHEGEKKESAKEKKEEEEKWAEESQEKEAGKKKGPGIPDATGPYGGTDKCQMSEKKKESDDESEKEEKEEEKEKEKKADEDKVVDTDILATIDFDGIELTNPMAITEVGEMSKEEKQRLSQLFRDPEFEKLSDDDRAKLEQFSK